MSERVSNSNKVDKALKLVKAAVKHTQEILPKFQISRNGWTGTYTGIEQPGDCGDVKVTIVSSEGGQVKEIKAVIGTEGVQN